MTMKKRTTAQRARKRTQRHSDDLECCVVDFGCQSRNTHIKNQDINLPFYMWQSHHNVEEALM